MVKQLNQKLAEEYPEVLELNAILSLAEQTWPRYGIPAKDLQDPTLRAMIELLLPR